MLKEEGRIIKMRRKHSARIAIYAIGIAVVLLISFVSEVTAFKNADLLTLQIKATAIKGESISQVLEGLASEYGIAVGIELGDQKLTPRREINLDLPETNLKDFLDSLIAKDPRYTWKLEGSVIHVWPVIGRDTLVATLLDTKVSPFAITDGTSRHRVYTDVMNLPEIKTKLIIAGVEPVSFLSSGSMTKLGKGALFNEPNLTLRELLDKIVLQTEMEQWVISRWGKNSEYITIKP